MEIQRDFKELLESFNASGVEYLVVGGYAVAHHGAPRYTGDIDLFVRPDGENPRRVHDALVRFGFGGIGLTEDDFAIAEHVVQLGQPPVRIDIITSLDGVSWRECWDGRDAGDYGGVPVNFIGRDALVKNKRATRRYKDLADLEALGERLEEP